MCGVFDVAYSSNCKHLSIDAVSAMNRSLYRQESGQHGLYQDDNVVLGCRRVSPACKPGLLNDSMPVGYKTTNVEGLR